MSWKKKFTTYTLFLTAVGTAAHCLNRFVFLSATFNKLLKTDPGRYYDSTIGRVYYEKSGSGSPLLLIHDLTPFSSSYEWSRVREELSKEHTVYTLDLPGCGRSEKTNLIYTDYLFVHLIKGFIRDVIKKETSVAATGESSAFVLMSCLEKDSLIGKVFLINPASLIKLSQVPTRKTKLLRQLICAPVIGTFLYNMLNSRRRLKEIFRTEYYYDPAKTSEREIDTYFESSHIGSTKSKYLFASLISRYTNINLSFCLKNLTNDIFILTGNGNPENISIAEAYQNQLPSIQIVEVEKTKHLPQLEAPGEIAEIILGQL